MRRKIFMGLLLATMLFIPTSVYKAVTEWEGTSAGDNQANPLTACGGEGCFCRWNNNNFAAAEITIAYYENGNEIFPIASGIVYNGSTSWVRNHISTDAIKWGKFPGSITGFAEKIEGLLLDSSGDYENMKTLFRLLAGDGVYDEYEEKIKKKEIKNGGLGTATGIRVVVEPIYTIMSRPEKEVDSEGNRCIYFGDISRKIASGTVHQLYADEGYYNYLTTNHYASAQFNGFIHNLYMDVDDIYKAASSAGKTNRQLMRELADDSIGWGRAVFAPFNSAIDARCNPDVEGVMTCCNKLNITEFDSIYNTDEYLTRKLTAVEVETQCKIVDSCGETAIIPTKCTSGENSGYVADSESWSCIFGNGNYYYDGNKYCQIYCRQEIKSSLPSSGFTVDQGRYMTVGGDISPITYTGKKICRVTSDGNPGGIDTNLFMTKFNDYNNLIPDAWNAAEVARLEAEAAENAKCELTNDKYACKAYGLTPEAQAECAAAGIAHRQLLEQHRQNWPDDTRSDEELMDALQAQGEALCVEEKTTCLDWYQEYTCKGYSSADSDFGQKEVIFYYNNRDNNKESEISYYQLVYSQLLDSYKTLVEYRDNELFAYNSCSDSYPLGITYDDFQPELTFDYEEPVYGGSWKLDGDSSGSDLKVVYYQGGSSFSGSANASSTSPWTLPIMSYKCIGGRNCYNTKVTVNYYNVTWWEGINTIVYNYSLPDNVYRYVLKTGESVHSVTGSDTYIDIGYSNLPIHFSTLPGSYDYIITLKTFGDENKFNKYIDYRGEDYVCDYNVDCKNIINFTNCEDYKESCGTGGNLPTCIKGLNVIYRTISLNSKTEAFPGIDGTGRTPGTNWNNSTVINDYILNNRGVSGYEVYKLDPLYEIELTPSLIKLFRKYNKEMNKKVVRLYNNTTSSKFGLAGYADFSHMTCTDGRNCKSDLLRGNVLNYEVIDVTGCEISSGHGYTNCGIRR